MSRIKQFFAAIAALGIAALAIWIGTILAVVLIVVLVVAALFGRIWFAKSIKKAKADMERAREQAARDHPDAVVIETEYTVDRETEEAVRDNRP